MEQGLRVGIVGAGNIARTVHLPSYRKAGAQVVAICDVQEQGARSFADDFGLTQVYTDYREMLEKEQLDVVSICVPNCFHHEIGVEALRAGCHVFCEKPPALTFEQAKEMQQTAEENHRVLGYNFGHRHRGEAKAIQDLLQKGELGNVYHCKVEAVRRRAIPGWGVFTNKEMQGGGALIDLGIHMLDLALWLMDFPEPVYVAAAGYDQIGKQGGAGQFGKWNGKDFTVEDGMFGFIQFANGMSLSLTATFALHLPQNETTRMNLEVYGDKAGVGLNPFQLHTNEQEVLVDKSIPFQNVEFQQAAIPDFIQAIEQGGQPKASGENVLLTQKIIEGLYEAARENRPVLF